MQAKNPIPIFDPYGLLPLHGETDVAITTERLFLRVVISYDTNGLNKGKFEMVFKNICFHSLTSFPGVLCSNFEYENTKEFTSLIKYEESEFAKAWDEHFQYPEKTNSHYLIYFTNANMRLEVIAENFEIIKSNNL